MCLGDASLFHEGRKPLFTLKTKLISSAVTSDPVLAELFTSVQNEEKLRSSDSAQVLDTHLALNK
jgi:hypothetical protein